MTGPPIRTCLGCRQKKSQEELWRFSLAENGLIVKDFKGLRKGRHAYCCPNDRCLHLFVNNKKKLCRAFRTEVLGCDEELLSLFGS